MLEIQHDAFYELARQYDPNGEYHFVGEVDYHLLRDEKPYAGLSSHRAALVAVFDRLVKDSIANQERARGSYGGDTAEQLTPLVYDIDKARAMPLAPQVFFYCPNIVHIDYYGNVRYDAEWRPNDDNFGTTVPYWYALMEPVHGKRNRPEDFKTVNGLLFPNGVDALDIYEWTTDWSDLFDAGHEWYGSCCWIVYDKSEDRYIVMLVSATD